MISDANMTALDLLIDCLREHPGCVKVEVVVHVQGDGKKPPKKKKQLTVPDAEHLSIPSFLACPIRPTDGILELLRNRPEGVTSREIIDCITPLIATRSSDPSKVVRSSLSVLVNKRGGRVQKRGQMYFYVTEES